MFNGGKTTTLFHLIKSRVKFNEENPASNIKLFISEAKILPDKEEENMSG